MFILQNASAGPPTLPGLSTDFMDVDPGIARFDLTLELADVDEHLSGWLEYSTDLFEAATIARMATHLRTLLEAIVANPEERISRLPLLPAGSAGGSCTVEWPQTNFGRLGTFFRTVCPSGQTCGGSRGGSAGRVRLSYRELARRSSAIADRLALRRSAPTWWSPCSLSATSTCWRRCIAVQRVGGAFLCLEPTLPRPGWRQIVRSSGAPLLLAGQSSAEVLGKVLSRMPARGRPTS